jgi:hypothetical protein
MPDYATWPAWPTKKQILERIDAFLSAFQHGDLGAAFRHCPPLVFVKGEGPVLRTDLDDDALARHLSHAMFMAIDGQEVVETQLGNAIAEDPRTWCALITPPSRVGYADVNLDFPGGEGVDDPDDTVATEAGEVLANVHLGGEVTDITGRYELVERDGAVLLAFANFDVM